MIVGGQTACTGHFNAREKAVFFIGVKAGWALELVWMFWRRDNSLVHTKIFKPQVFQYMS
jgi:hypothetical protein